MGELPGVAFIIISIFEFLTISLVTKFESESSS